MMNRVLAEAVRGGRAMMVRKATRPFTGAPRADVKDGKGNELSRRWDILKKGKRWVGLMRRLKLRKSGAPDNSRRRVRQVVRSE